MHAEGKLQAVHEELARLDQRREQLVALIRQLEQAHPDRTCEPTAALNAPVTSQSPPEQKIAFFRSLFRGREDAFPRRFESRKTGKSGYQPACRNEWTKGLCDRPRIKCAECSHREYIPVTDEVIRKHLAGSDPEDRYGKDFVIGVYPLLPDETCWFLAADFDKTTWLDDTRAFLETCRRMSVPAALERSRSGNGGHIWIFFREPIPAALARKVGAYILTETMERRPEIGLDSYDRFFPSQDTLPQGGFGNLIALPLQKRARERGNSLFLDGNGVPHPDQWAFLSLLPRMPRDEVERLVREAMDRGRIIGVRAVVTEEDDDEPWTASPSRRHKDPPIVSPLPERIEIVLGNQLFIAKEGLPPSLRNRLVRFAAFQNPEFYKAQAMRLSTFDKPRIIGCCEDFPKHVGLPRGCLEEVLDLLEGLKIKAAVRDERNPGIPIDVSFLGELRPEQKEAVEALLPHDMGVLSATTAFGKTVVAAHMVAVRRVNALVLVHRRQLQDQWIAQLGNFLGLDKKRIGVIGGGKHKATGFIDVAIVQSLCRKGVVDDCVAGYGHLIVDECHHISAPSFEQIAKQSKARYVLGLSATVTRKDGHHPIIFMNCGPIRYRVDAKRQAEARPFEHKVVVRTTEMRLPPELQFQERPSIQAIYAALAADKERNHLIVSDVFAAVNAGRSPVVLTERTDHLEWLVESLSRHVPNVITLRGGMGRKQRAAITEKIASIPDSESRVLASTGRYLGEGFDDARLDTLFLALPVSWKGTISQYAGRLHRLHDRKREVVIYDYADLCIPMLARMFERRSKGYRALGYTIADSGCVGSNSGSGPE